MGEKIHLVLMLLISSDNDAPVHKCSPIFDSYFQPTAMHGLGLLVFQFCRLINFCTRNVNFILWRVNLYSDAQNVLIYYVSQQMFIFATNSSVIYFNAQSAPTRQQKVPAEPGIAQSIPTRQQKVPAVPRVYH